MRLHRAPFALSLLAALLAVPASAQDTTSSSSTTDASSTAASTSVSTVAISGTVSGVPESVVFSGDAKLKNKLVRDPDFNSPRYILTIDLSGVTGVGAQTRKKYSIPGPAIQQKNVVAAHVVDITFPFQESGSTELTARSGVASFTLSFDVATGAITAATGSVASPNF